MISKEKNIKICFVSAGLEGGGMERSLTNIANYAAGKGYQVTILNLFKTDVFFDLHPDITLIWPDLDRASTHRLQYAARLIPYIRQQLKQVKPDTVLSFGEWFNAYVIMATKFLGIPVFVSDRMGPMLKIGFLLETTRRIMYRFATGIISQTTTAEKILFQKTGAKNIIVIPNALNVIDTDTTVKKKTNNYSRKTVQRKRTVSVNKSIRRIGKHRLDIAYRWRWKRKGKLGKLGFMPRSVKKSVFLWSSQKF